MGSIHNIDVCRSLDQNKIIDCVNKGLDRSLETSEDTDIVLEIIKKEYGVDGKDITSSSLDVFEASLVEAFDSYSANVFLNAIANECMHLRIIQNTNVE
jgi:hypothetical protein